jgi:hypothetical protein
MKGNPCVLLCRLLCNSARFPTKEHCLTAHMPCGSTPSRAATQQARFIRDCTSYMQSCAHPARDVFTQPDQLVASLVVVPLVHGDGPPLAAMYLTLEAPNDFTSIQGPLLVCSLGRAAPKPAVKAASAAAKQASKRFRRPVHPFPTAAYAMHHQPPLCLLP